MNLNYSYRAFLITSLLFGILVMTLWSIKISSEIPEKLETLPVEYAELEEEETPELAKNLKQKRERIQTNRAYNEAEEFIKNSENDYDLLNEEQMQDEIEASPVNELSNNANEALIEAKKKLEIKKETPTSNGKSASRKKKGANRKTTILYSLKNRKAIRLPNPVYTCEGGGKVVINIEVNASGKITKTKFNKTASTTSNGCLIDSAIDYALSSKFTQDSRKTQRGSITYIFPGQY